MVQSYSNAIIAITFKYKGRVPRDVVSTIAIIYGVNPNRVKRDLRRAFKGDE